MPNQELETFCNQLSDICDEQMQPDMNREQTYFNIIKQHIFTFGNYLSSFLKTGQKKTSNYDTDSTSLQISQEIEGKISNFDQKNIIQNSSQKIPSDRRSLVEHNSQLSIQLQNQNILNKLDIQLSKNSTQNQLQIPTMNKPSKSCSMKIDNLLSPYKNNSAAKIKIQAPLKQCDDYGEMEYSNSIDSSSDIGNIQEFDELIDVDQNEKISLIKISVKQLNKLELFRGQHYVNESYLLKSNMSNCHDLLNMTGKEDLTRLNLEFVETISANEKVFKKGSVDQLSMSPYFIFGENDGQFMIKNGEMMWRSQGNSKDHGNILQLGQFIFPDNKYMQNLKKKYRFYITSNQNKNDLQTFTIRYDNLYSHQLKKENKTGIHYVNHTEIKKDDQDRIFVRDLYSKSGTFVGLRHSNPIILEQKQLIMLNDIAGFYVKSLVNSSDMEVSSRDGEIQTYSSALNENFVAPYEKFQMIDLNNQFSKNVSQLENTDKDKAMIKIVFIKKNEQFQYFEEYKTCIMNASQEGEIQFGNIKQPKNLLENLLLGYKCQIKYKDNLKLWYLQTESLINSFEESTQFNIMTEPINAQKNLIKGINTLNLFDTFDFATDHLQEVSEISQQFGVQICVSPFDPLQSRFESVFHEVGQKSQIIFDRFYFRVTSGSLNKK